MPVLLHDTLVVRPLVLLPIFLKKRRRSHSVVLFSRFEHSPRQYRFVPNTRENARFFGNVILHGSSATLVWHTFWHRHTTASTKHVHKNERHFGDPRVSAIRRFYCIHIYYTRVQYADIAKGYSRRSRHCRYSTNRAWGNLSIVYTIRAYTDDMTIFRWYCCCRDCCND